MTNICDCCQEFHTSLVVYEASNPQQVALCDECRTDLIWYTLATAAPREIWDLLHAVQKWSRERRDGENPWIGAAAVPKQRQAKD